MPFRVWSTLSSTALFFAARVLLCMFQEFRRKTNKVDATFQFVVQFIKLSRQQQEQQQQDQQYLCYHVS